MWSIIVALEMDDWLLKEKFVNSFYWLSFKAYTDDVKDNFFFFNFTMLIVLFELQWFYTVLHQILGKWFLLNSPVCFTEVIDQAIFER